MKNVYLFLLFLLCLFLLNNCDRSEKKETPSKPTIEAAAFDADSAFSFVEMQTDFGPRVPNTEAHRQCGELLYSKMLQYADTVIVQDFIAVTYDGQKLKSKNIIAVFSPEKEKRILLGAHWDSRPIADYDLNPDNRKTPIDGANDGASGVGVLIELARQLHLNRPDVGIDIIFFDAEDWGTPQSEDVPGDWWCLGSQYWSKSKHIPGYKAQYGILLDMVGAADATFFHEGFSRHYASNIVSKVWGLAHQLGFGRYFINKSSNYITDDHYYINTLVKIPMINIVHQDNATGTGFYPYWHTVEDNIDKIDKNTLQVVGKTVLTHLYQEK